MLPEEDQAMVKVTASESLAKFKHLTFEICSQTDVNVNEQFLSPRESCNIVTTAAP